MNKTNKLGLAAMAGPFFYSLENIFNHNWTFRLWCSIVSSNERGDIMSVFRVHKTKNFTVMSNYHFKEKEMGLKAKGLLSLMLSLPDSWNYSVSGLVSLSKDGKDGVMSALAELEKFGYLTRKRVQNEKGQFSGVEYHIFEIPQTEKPISEKPISDIPNAENQQLLSTNKIKFLKNKKINNNSNSKNDFMNELKRIYQELEQDGE